MNDVAAIVLAAGSGTRFGKPKQFLELRPGVRLVDAALESTLDVTENVILVLPDGYDWNGQPVRSVVTGGETRLDSVAAGLAVVAENMEIVVVHDAAHPLAQRQTFVDVIEAVRKGADAAVPFLPVSDVVKQRRADNRVVTVGRDDLGLTQVPMAFSRDRLVFAHQQLNSGQAGVWEDSTLLERVGGRVIGVAGSSTNIHIITAEDLELSRIIAGISEPSSTDNTD